MGTGSEEKYTDFKNKMKYYFYNPETGCGWEDKLTYLRRNNF